MKKRLDAATALVHRPPLVFLDEPTTGLDPAARNRLWEYFERINEEGTTIVLTTQYLEEADQPSVTGYRLSTTADRCHRLAGGAQTRGRRRSARRRTDRGRDGRRTRA